MPAPKKRVTTDDLYRLKVITGCALSPDGKSILYGLQRVDKKTQKKYANLWCVSIPSGSVRQFTYGDQVDSQPKWSPSGQDIAFLSNRGDEDQTQLFVIAFHGGEARPLTKMKGDFGSFVWSPDGKSILCQFRKKDAEVIHREEDEQAKKLGIVARHINRTFYKLDGEGYLPHERWHLWLIDARSGRARQLTDGDTYDEWDPTWSPDGKSAVFCSNHAPDPDLDPDAVDLFRINLASGDMTRIDTPFGEKRLPSVSPDGRTVAYFGFAGRGEWWRNQGLWTVSIDGRGTQNLSETYDICVESLTLGDVGTPELRPPAWIGDGSRLVFQVMRHGNTTLQSIAADGTDLMPVVDDDGVVGSYDLDAKRERLAFVWNRIDNPCQVWVADADGGHKRRMSNVNNDWLPRLDLGRVETVWFKGAAANDLQGWILHPPDFDPARKYPVIIEIHGGPLLQYGNAFMFEFYFLAANGYVVAFCNPRGGQGYGETHAKAIWNAWGTADYEDVMAWTDYVAALPYVDASRMGITGGSYGGFLTNWIIGHTDRFKAAATQRSVSNQVSMWGSSDFNWVFQYEVGGRRPPWETTDLFWSLSPMKHIGNARTPTLVLHSENDFRCAIEQGEQIYVALKTLGVDTEFVVFPEESHGLSRTGRTDRKIARLGHILRWFDRYLKPESPG